MESETICEDHENGSNSLNLTPVAPEQSGKGLPYAPENWPNPGDVWTWRTGRRVAPNGNFRDRYLYPPRRLFGPRSRRPSFRSKLSVQNFIKETFPHVNVKDFFDSFNWNIPSGNTSAINDASLKQFELPEESESDFLDHINGCKAGNPMCISLVWNEEDECFSVMPCDICCAEPNFCRDCCCILCYKTVDSKYGGYTYIKCQAKVGDDICGHIGHIECALRCYIAGTVGGSIGLDAEYFCRCCDGRTDLIPHAKKLLLTCEYINSKDDDIKKKILNLCFCFLRGSQKAAAKELISQIQLAMSKLNHGTDTKDIENVGDNLTAHSGLANSSNAVMDIAINVEAESPLDVSKGTESVGYLSEISNLEAEVDSVLEALRESQEYEYIVAEERLNKHKKYLQNLELQLEYEKSELANQPRGSQSDFLFQHVRKREEQLRRAVLEFEEMKKVANGFGSTSKDIIKKHFGLKVAN